MAVALGKIKVLDFTRAYAGPTCTRLLAELGAEIIKIEMPDVGDFTRGSPPFNKAGESGYWVTMNRGKKSLTLNLQSEQGCQIIRDLVKKVDVLIENFSPGVMDRLGFSYQELSKLNPGLIYASISGFGHTGPRALESSLDIIAQAMGGIISVNGPPGEPPIQTGVPIADWAGGIFTAIAILSALHYRSETGEGQAIDTSLQDIMWSLAATQHSHIYFLENKIPPKFGNKAVTVAPWNIYQAKDGYVIVATNTLRHWENLVSLVNSPELMDAKYNAREVRLKDSDKIDAIIQEWTKTKNVADLLKQLNDVSVPCSSVPSFDQVANDPQLLSRDMITEVDQPLSGKVKVPGSVFKLSRTPGNPRLPAATLGQHNNEILSGMLGYSEQEIKKLEDEGVI